MKRKFISAIVGIYVLTMLSGCGGNAMSNSTTPGSAKESNAAAASDTRSVSDSTKAMAAKNAAKHISDTVKPTSPSSFPLYGNPTEQQLQKIKEDYLKNLKEDNQKLLDNGHPMGNKNFDLTLDNILIDSVWGIYNGCTVLYIRSDEVDFSTAIETLTVNGYSFSFSDSYVVSVYKDGDFARLDKAYDNGWITSDDLKAMSESYGAE